jgi:TolB protein
VALVVALVVISILQRPSSLTPKSNGDLIAHVRQDFYKPKSDEIYLVHTDGTSPVNLTRNNADDYSPAWSPDGRRIAFMSERTGRPEIFVMDADGSNVIQVSHSTEVGFSRTGALPSLHLVLGWSPDSKHLVALAHPPDAPASPTGVISIFKSDGSGGWQIPEKPFDTNICVLPERYPYAPPQWSPDGARIAFIGTRHSDDTLSCGAGRILSRDLFVVSSDGSELKNLSLGDGSEVTAFTWSPDGTRLAYLEVTRHDDFRSSAELKLVNTDGSEQATLSAVDPPAYGIHTDLHWSPDGTHLLFALTSTRSTLQRHLYLIDLNNARLTPLPDLFDNRAFIGTGIPVGYSAPTWSPDGQWILYTTWGVGPHKVFKLSLADAQAQRIEPIQLTFGEEVDTTAQWQPATDK